MSVKKIPALVGVDNRREDAALEVQGRAPSLHVRDAVNVDFTETGRVRLRDGVAMVTDTPFQFLWQSPLHGDCFATLGHDWVKVHSDWSHEVLLPDVARGHIEHMVLNNKVLMASEQGLFVYDGQHAMSFQLPTPAEPLLQQAANGSGDLSAGEYSVAVSWLRNGMESGLSALGSVVLTHQAAMDVVLPYCFDASITHVKVYVTEHSGSELREYAFLPIDQTQVQITNLQELSRSAAHQHLTAMKTGHSLGLWRGRLMVAQKNVLYFSEPMNYHLMDPRFNFVQLPQRIRFALPVDGGIWVGQQDHVVFLRGSDLKNMSMERKASQAPIAHSGILLGSEQVGAELSQGGAFTALWLAANGYVMGLASGQMVEVQQAHLQHLSASHAQSVGFGKRVFSLVT